MTRTTGPDREQAEVQFQGWSAEIDTLKGAVAQAEAETRAEFNVLLAAVSPSRSAAWEQPYTRHPAVAEQVEVQLQEWRGKVTELKAAVARVEAEAREVYNHLFAVLRANDRVAREWLQVVRAAGDVPGAARLRERGADVATLQARASKAAAEAREAYSALLAVLHTDGTVARDQRRVLFSATAVW